MSGVTCPICGVSLDTLAPGARTRHVSACLGEEPVASPAPSGHTSPSGPPKPCSSSNPFALLCPYPGCGKLYEGVDFVSHVRIVHDGALSHAFACPLCTLLGISYAVNASTNLPSHLQNGHPDLWSSSHHASASPSPAPVRPTPAVRARSSSASVASSNLFLSSSPSVSPPPRPRVPATPPSLIGSSPTVLEPKKANSLRSPKLVNASDGEAKKKEARNSSSVDVKKKREGGEKSSRGEKEKAEKKLEVKTEVKHEKRERGEKKSDGGGRHKAHKHSSTSPKVPKSSTKSEGSTKSNHTHVGQSVSSPTSPVSSHSGPTMTTPVVSASGDYLISTCLTDLSEECGICYEEFVVGAVAARLGCFCLYHKDCIEMWFTRKGKHSCPLHIEDEETAK